MTAPTPLLDFFKRGEVARDVRLLAAQGVLAPRASEQLAILIVLQTDPDAEVQRIAEATLNGIPVEAIKGFIARPDIPAEIREFFGARGIVPAAGATGEVHADEPLFEAVAAPPHAETADARKSGLAKPGVEEDADRESITQQLATMSFTDRLKAAMKGSKEMRAVLIRDPNKMIAAAVLSSPKVTQQEVESFSRMANVTEDVLRIIGSNRAWMKNYGVVAGLTRNPKTPIGMSMNLLARLNDRDLQMISMDRNVPGALRIAARKKALENVSKK